MTLTKSQKDLLFGYAQTARVQAYAPYSSFKVGAAILCSDDEVHLGCNVENVAYPEGTCAEAGAIAAMCVSGRKREIVAVMVIADSTPPVTPCGGCRQKLAEFGAPHVPVYLADLDGIQAEMTLEDLLPGAFSTQHLGQKT